MAAIKAAVGIAADIAGSVIRVGMVPPLAAGIAAVVMLGSSDTMHADTGTDTFFLGVISAVMLAAMLIAGCVAIVSQRHSASHQQGNDCAMQQARSTMSGSIQLERAIALPLAADHIGRRHIADVNEFKHGSTTKSTRPERR